jgi:hypothetical protein
LLVAYSGFLLRVWFSISAFAARREHKMSPVFESGKGFKPGTCKQMPRHVSSHVIGVVVEGATDCQSWWMRR